MEEFNLLDVGIITEPNEYLQVINQFINKLYKGFYQRARINDLQLTFGITASYAFLTLGIDTHMQFIRVKLDKFINDPSI